MFRIWDLSKHAKRQWEHDPSTGNVDSLNNVRCVVSRYSRKRKEYLKAKTNEHETNSKIRITGYLYRGISDFNKGYQPRMNVVKDENGDLFIDSHSILSK